VPANTYGQYFDLDFLAGFCWLGFRGTAARAFMTRLEGLRFRFASGFLMPPSCQSCASIASRSTIQPYQYRRQPSLTPRPHED
jgi:uncharacterized membrane protein YjgN (DUF898 family)